jgi:hypothetical protein
MTCHSQIWTGAAMLEPLRASLSERKPLEWQRVARVPDHVYFNHSIHLSRCNGVSIVTAILHHASNLRRKSPAWTGAIGKKSPKHGRSIMTWL